MTSKSFSFGSCRSLGIRCSEAGDLVQKCSSSSKMATTGFAISQICSVDGIAN